MLGIAWSIPFNQAVHISRLLRASPRLLLTTAITVYVHGIVDSGLLVRFLCMAKVHFWVRNNNRGWCSGQSSEEPLKRIIGNLQWHSAGEHNVEHHNHKSSTIWSETYPDEFTCAQWYTQSVNIKTIKNAGWAWYKQKVYPLSGGNQFFLPRTQA